MTRALLSLLLAFTAASTSAIEFPWQQSALSETPEYCKGFVTAGLASREVTGASRTDLWLAWSYVIRSGALNDSATKDEYLSGREQFQRTQYTAAAGLVLRKAEGQCGLGKTGHQITGW